MNNEDIHGPVPEDTGDGSGLPAGKQAFQNITRELSDKDLTNPAVGKLLLDERDRLESEKAELRNSGKWQERAFLLLGIARTDMGDKRPRPCAPARASLDQQRTSGALIRTPNRMTRLPRPTAPSTGRDRPPCLSLWGSECETLTAISLPISLGAFILAEARKAVFTT